MIESILGDVRYSFRVLVNHGRFSLLVVLILALGIGATTAIFSAVSSVVLAPLPFGESERVARVLIRSESDGQVRTTGVTPLFFNELRDRSRMIEHSTAQMFLNLSLRGPTSADRIIGIGVSDSWSETLGVSPILGRGFSAGEDSGVVLLSYGLWQERFGGDEAVLGKVLMLNQQPHSVIGVMPPSFQYPYGAEVWTPMRFPPEPDQPGYLNVAARMKPGVTLEAMQAEVRQIGDELGREFVGRGDVSLVARPFAEEFGRDPSHSIAVLLAAVSFVLLLACVNVANLLLVRSGARARDFAIRTALGASRGRQIRQLLVESLILAFVSGVMGVGLAFVTARWLSLLIPNRLSEVIQNVSLDTNALLFALIATTMTAVLFGLMPAFRLTDAQPVDAMKSGGRLGSVKGRVTMRWLVVTEVALAFVLMVGAAVMGQEFIRQSGSEIGYDPTNLMRVGVGLPRPAYDDPETRVTAIERIVDEVESIPGVSVAGATSLHPIPRTRTNTGARLFRRGDEGAEDVPVVNSRVATPSYLAALGLVPLRGRLFSESDRHGGSPVVVVSQEAADRYWPGEDAVGAQVRFTDSTEGDAEWWTIVGIVPDIAEPYEQIRGTVYQPYAQGTWTQTPGVWDTTSVTLLIRTNEGAGAVLNAVRSKVGKVDRDVSLFDISDLETVLAEPLQGQRFGAFAFIGFAGFGLLLALIGTYGVIALSVQVRLPEFGIRVAMGLDPAGLLRIVLRYGMGLVLAGLGIGVGIAIGLSRFLDPVVSQVSARDPVTFVVAAVAVVLAGVAASFVPARRAMNIDPLEALREE